MVNNKNDDFKFPKLKIPIEILIHETETTIEQFKFFKVQNIFLTHKDLHDTYYLKSGSEKIAYGKFVNKKGKFFFKIIKLFNSREELV